MISKKMVWFAGLALVGLLLVTQWAGNFPARVVVINQGPTIQNVRVIAGGRQLELGTMRSGETRTVTIASGDYATLEFDASRHRRWQSPDKIAPAQSLTLRIRNEHVDSQRPRPD